MGQLELFLATLDVEFSCIAISETWFEDNSFLGQFNLEGYNLFSSSRETRSGGGVCVYVKSQFQTRVETVRLEGSDSLLVHIGEAGRDVCSLLALYRSPSGHLSSFLGDLAEMLPSLPSSSVVVGDINIDVNYENTLDKISCNYLDLIGKYGYFNTISSPTRFGKTKTSILDHILIKNYKQNIRSFTINYQIADHLPVCLAFSYKQHSDNNKNTSTNATFQKIDYQLLRDNLENCDWHSVYICTDTNLAFNEFQTTMTEAIERSSKSFKIKSGKSSRKSFQKEWMTPELFKLTKKRTELHGKAKDQPFNKTVQEQYVNFRNFVTTRIKEAKRNYFKFQFSQCKNNQNEKWRFIKSLLNKNRIAETNCIALKDDQQKVIDDPKAVSEIFNKFFTNIGTNLSMALPPPKTDFRQYFDLPNLQHPKFDFHLIGVQEIIDILKSLSIKKSTGYDKIPIKALKDNKYSLAPVLAYIVNLSIQNSVFPDLLKVARVKPLHKKGDPTNCSNYRPISILSAISKILEKILAAQINEFFEENQIFTDSQFGFRKCRNTTGAINRLMEDLYINFNSSKITQGIFLDFSKAFDTIDHDILIQKLTFYNFTDNSKDFIKCYLSNRKQFVQINHANSSFLTLKKGVPQGSVLGPLLFLIFINDLLKASPSLKYILFADDTNIFSTEPSKMKIELSNIEDWCIANKLIINYDKTIQVIFRAPNKRLDFNDFSLNLNNIPLQIKPDTKFLGITLDASITFSKHIAELCRKLNLCLFMMRAIAPYLDQKALTDIYYTFFYPHLLYGLEFWGHGNKTDLKRVLIIQKASLRVILKLKPNAHVTTYFEKLKIMPVDMLFKYSVLKMLLKTFSPEKLEEFSKSHNYNTRSDKLKPIKTNNNRGGRSLLCSGIELYNRYLLGWKVASLPVAMAGLAGRLWAAV